jgi:hypothetical protein
MKHRVGIHEWRSTSSRHDYHSPVRHFPFWSAVEEVTHPNGIGSAQAGDAELLPPPYTSRALAHFYFPSGRPATIPRASAAFDDPGQGL